MDKSFYFVSDDLDLFVNDDRQFLLWADRLIQGLSGAGLGTVQVLMREERFVRLNLTQGTTQLKIEMVNDVPAHVGEIADHPVLGRLDSAENILANKVTALLDREEPKIWRMSGDFAVGWDCRFQPPWRERKARLPGSSLSTWRESSVQ